VEIIQPKIARSAEGQRPASKTTTGRKKPRPSPKSNLEGLTAREKAEAIAAEKYQVEPTTRSGEPLTAAERRQRRRQTHVPISIEVTPEIAAKLKALADAKGTSQVAIIRDLIDRARLPPK